MSEIKRYAITQVRECSQDMFIVDAVERQDGEWVRWEDVQVLIDCLELISTMEDGLGLSVEAWEAKEALEEVGIKL